MVKVAIGREERSEKERGEEECRRKGRKGRKGGGCTSLQLPH